MLGSARPGADASCTRPSDARRARASSAPSARTACAHAGRALLRWGTTPAAGYKAARARYPDEPAIIDELGTLTFREVHERTNALAHALAGDGVGEGDGVAIMCRNHRGFVEAMVACSKLGANALFLNTAFSGPQLTDVGEAREARRRSIYDEEFAEVLEDAGQRRKRYVAWHEPGEPPQRPDARGADRARRPAAAAPPPSEPGRA